MRWAARVRLCLACATLAFALHCPSPALASTCAGSPSGNEGDVMYNLTYHLMQYCNGTAWINMGAASSGTLGVTSGGTGTSTQFTQGSVVFAGASGVYSQNNANFFWDNTNNRLGIGTSTPSYPIDVETSTATYAIYANSTASSGYAVYGNETGTNGTGVYGYSSSSGNGVSGLNSSTGNGIYGSNSGAGVGVYGYNSSTGSGGYFSGGSYALITGTGNVGIGTTTPAQKLTIYGNVDASSGSGYLTEIGNATTTGTTVNKLAKLSAGSAVIGTTGDTDGMIGVVVGGAGTSGNAQIAVNGQASCIFDGTTAAGDFVTISSSVAGDCSDVGSTRSTTAQTIGRVLTVNSGAGTAATVAMGLNGVGGSTSSGTVWQMVASTDIASPVTSYNFSGLNGDTDGEYQIVTRIIAGSTTTTSYYVLLNGDTTAGDYGYQLVQASGSSANGGYSTSAGGLYIGYTTSSGNISSSTNFLYAKSGGSVARTMLSIEGYGVTGTSSGIANVFSSSWSNTASTITSIQVLASVASGLGVGTHLELWAKRNVGGAGSTTTAAGTTGYVQFNGGSNAFAGSANLYWDNTNSRLGVGTIAPGYPLDIYNSQNAQTILHVSNPNTGTASQSAVFAASDTAFAGMYAQSSGYTTSGNFQATGVTFYASSAATGGLTLAAGYSSAPIRFVINNSEEMRIISSGYVGIGTTNPQFELTNSAQTNVTGGFSGLGASGHTFVWEHPATDTATGYGAAFLNSTTGGGGNGLLLKTVDATSATNILEAYSGSSTKFLVRADGNVGIGTSSPGYPLDVETTTAASAIYGNSNVSSGYAVYANATGTTSNGVYGSGTNAGVMGNSSSGNGVNGSSTSGTGVYGTSTSGNGVTGASSSGIGGYFGSFSGYALITSLGNVGINTATPSQPLTIYGNVDAMNAGYLTEIGNETTTGTLVNKLAKLSAGSAIIGTTGDTDGMIGIVVGGAGTSGNAQIAVGGQVACRFDNATTAGHFVTIGNMTTYGDCHDSGAATRPTSGQVIGRVLTTGSSNTNETVELGLNGPGGSTTSAAGSTGYVQFNGGSSAFSGSANLFWDNTNSRLGIGTTSPSQPLTIYGNVDASGGSGYLTEIANATTTGTTVNKLAKLSAGSAVIGTTGDTDGMIGIVVGGAGTSGNAQIAVNGQASCVFENATTAGDFVVVGSSTAGDCHDSGSATRPTSGQVIGRVLTTVSAGSSATVALALNGSSGGSGGGSMTYPGAGIANSTGSAWGTSYTAAAAADVQAGTSTTKLVTPAALSASAAILTLTYGSTISWNMASGYNAQVTLTGSGATISAPTNYTVGQTYTLQITQDSTGSRTIGTWPTSFDWGSAGTPTLTITASATDLVTLLCVSSAPKFFATINQGF